MAYAALTSVEYKIAVLSISALPFHNDWDKCDLFERRLLEELDFVDDVDTYHGFIIKVSYREDEELSGYIHLLDKVSARLVEEIDAETFDD